MNPLSISSVGELSSCRPLSVSTVGELYCPNNRVAGWFEPIEEFNDDDEIILLASIAMKVIHE